MSTAFFIADDGIHGRELWVSDGTAAGTHMIEDLTPGSGSSVLTSLAPVGGIEYFLKDSALWRSDGTEDGTFALSSSGTFRTFFILGGKVYFFATNSLGSGLFSTDGTGAGTSLISTQQIGTTLRIVGNVLFYTANDGVHGTELWRTDGTAAGTGLVSDLTPGSGSSAISNPTVLGDSLLFTFNNGTNGSELWISNGTAAGTQLLLDLNPGAASSSPTAIRTIGSLAFFNANDGTGVKLWVTDGSAAGTHQLAVSGSPTNIATTAGGYYYFAQNPASGGLDFYRTDGTAVTSMGHFIGLFALTSAGGRVVVSGQTASDGAGIFVLGGASPELLAAAPLGGNFGAFLDSGGKFYFTVADPQVGYILYVSDGTQAGTHQLAYGVLSNLAALGNGVIFQSIDPAHGAELFYSDGTAAGTGLLADIFPGTDHSASGLFGYGSASVNGRLVYSANDPAGGNELFVSDGTVTGTHLLADLAPGYSDSAPGEFYSFAGWTVFRATNGTSHFYATDGASTVDLGALQSDGIIQYVEYNGKLYAVGSSGHTVEFTVVPGGPVSATALNWSAIADVRLSGVVGGRLLVLGVTGGASQVFAFDGTSFAPVSAIAASFADPFFSQAVVSGDKLYFRATDAAHGTELWVTDGTAAGTHLVADVFSGSNTGTMSSLSSLGDGRILFSGYDGTSGGPELWISDGTALGTHQLRDINTYGNPTASTTYYSGRPGYFLGSEADHGLEIFVTDGTPAGTHVIDKTPGPLGSPISDTLTVGGKVYAFIVTGVEGVQLFVSDGGAFTQLTSAAAHNAPFYQPKFYVLGNSVYYLAADASGNFGNALFKTDGTVAGTTLVTQFSGFSSEPFNTGTALIFQSYDSVLGTGTYTFDGSQIVRINNSPFNSAVMSGGKIFFLGQWYSNSSDLWTTDGTAAGTRLVGQVGINYPFGNLLNSLGDGRVLFQAGDAATGTELYVSDGTAAGTHIVTDLNKQVIHAASSDVHFLTARGAGVVFYNSDSLHGPQLWSSDGTLGGTHRAADIAAGASGGSPTDILTLGSKTYFVGTDQSTSQLFVEEGGVITRLTFGASTPVLSYTAPFIFNGKVYYAGSTDHGAALWSTDGTVAGTTLAIDFGGTGSVGAPTVVNGKLVFWGYIAAPFGSSGLYAYDGTSLQQISDTTQVSQVFVSGTNMYFNALSSGGSGAWVTDGTAIGSHPITDPSGILISSADNFADLGGGKVIFRGYDSTHGAEAWATDGTVAGTHLLADIIPGIGSTSPYVIASNGIGYILTNYYDPATGWSQYELYVTDGTAAGTHLVKDFTPGAQIATFNSANSAGGKAYVSLIVDGVSRVWVSDGSAAAPHVLLDSSGAALNKIQYLFNADATHFFFVGNLNDLYYSDGTDAGTIKLTTVISFDPSLVKVAGGRLFFGNFDQQDGTELWVSDGTVSGTMRVTDGTIPGSSYPSSISVAGSLTFFMANDGVHSYNSLFVTDGTEAGTHLVRDFGTNSSVSFFTSGQKAFINTLVSGDTYVTYVSDGTPAGTVPFVVNGTQVARIDHHIAFDATHFFFEANGLYFSDGTTAGTVRVGNLFSTSLENASISNGRLILQASDGINGSEVWATDGSVAGTAMLTDQRIPGGSNPSQMVRAGSLTYFLANDGEHGQQLWVSDATATGTHLLPSLGAPLAATWGDYVVGGKFYFAAVSTSSSGIFVTDGTAAGTVRLTNVATTFSQPVVLDAAHVFFATDSGLYVTDGTALGTQLIMALGGIANIQVVDATLYFTTTTAADGEELWRSDGTLAGTVRLTDTTLPNSSVPTGFVTALNIAPHAFADGAVVLADQTATAGTRQTGLLGNDSDIDPGDAATLTIVGAHAGNATDTVVAPAGMTTLHGLYGDLLLGADGTWSYTATGGTVLSAGISATDSFSYTVADSHGARGTSQFAITVTGTGVAHGTPGNDTRAGSPGDDLFDFSQGGTDNLSTFGGNDRIVIGSGGGGSLVDGGPGSDTLAINGNVPSLGTLVGIEAVELSGGGALTLTGAQFANGLSFSSTLSGTGSITVNLTAGVDFFSTLMTPDAGSNVTFTVNGTSGGDIIKSGQFATTVNAGDGDDLVRTGNLVDTINGGDGNDKIAGRGGADVLTGGAGADTFRYVFDTDSGLGVNADHITDFAIGSDKLAFRALDPNLVTPGIQAFTFIGSAAFHATGTAEIHYANSGADLLVEADLNGDGIADMQIVLDSLAGQTLTSADFLL